MGATLFAPSPGTPLASMVKIYSKHGKLPLGLSLKSLIGSSYYWTKYTNEDPTRQWPDDGSLELGKLLNWGKKYVLRALTQLFNWYLKNSQKKEEKN